MSQRDPVDKTDESSILEYIKVSASAFDRSRTVIIVMLVASVFVFTQVRNSDGWLDRRISVRIHALRLLDDKFDLDKEILSKNPEDRVREWYAYMSARTYIRDADFKMGNRDDKERLKAQLTTLIRARDEQMRLIRIPFFGAVYDANDTGIFAGVTFTVVLFWLALTIKRERRNLQITFGKARNLGKLEFCFNLLAMQQVLTVPPTKPNQSWLPLGYISKVLYIMPLLVYAWLFHHEWESRGTGNTLGWDKITTLLWACGVFLFFILILTIICVITRIKIDRDWSSYTSEVRSIPDASID